MHELHLLIEDITQESLDRYGLPEDNLDFFVNQACSFFNDYPIKALDIRQHKRIEVVLVDGQLVLLIDAHLRLQLEGRSIDIHISFLDMNATRYSSLLDLVALATPDLPITVWTKNVPGSQLGDFNRNSPADLAKLGKQIQIAKEIAQLQDGVA